MQCGMPSEDGRSFREEADLEESGVQYLTFSDTPTVLPVGSGLLSLGGSLGQYSVFSISLICTFLLR